jgi:signal transduction histidine kinase
VKAIVEAHQGGVEVSSKPGQGSEFRVRLPKGNPLAPRMEKQETRQVASPDRR